MSYVNSVYNLTYDQNKCRRDTKFIIESIAYDLIYGSNAESTDSGLKYYDGVKPDNKKIEIQEKQFKAFKLILKTLENYKVNYVLVQAPITQQKYKSYTNISEFNDIMYAVGDYYNFNNKLQL